MALALGGFSLAYVLAGLPMGAPGLLTEAYAPRPEWIMGVWFVAPGVSILVFSAGVARARPAVPRLVRLIPWLWVGLTFWALKSAVHLRQAGPASNDFYFTAMTGPGAFTAQAMQIEDAAGYLRRFPEMASGHWSEFGGTRVISNPPGTILLLYGCRKLLGAYPWLQEYYAEEPRPPAGAGEDARRSHQVRALAQFAPDVFLFLAALGMAPLWWLASHLLPPESAAAATGLSALVPSLHVYSFSNDAFQLALILWMWWATHCAVRSASLGWGLLAGLLLSVGLQFSLSFLIAAVIPAAIAALARPTRPNETPQDESRPQRPWGVALAAVAGLVLPWMLLWAVTGYEPWLGLLSAYRGHAQYHRDFGQPYPVWIWLNLFHLLLFMGGPAAAALLQAGYDQVVRTLRQRSLRGLDPYFMGTSGTLLLLNFSGKNLGEVARLWLFFMPALLLVSLKALGEKERNDASRALSLAIGLQALQAAVFTLKFDPLGSHRALTGNLFQGLP